jgi:hypothetical protein
MRENGGKPNGFNAWRRLPHAGKVVCSRWIVWGPFGGREKHPRCPQTAPEGSSGFHYAETCELYRGNARFHRENRASA